MTPVRHVLLIDDEPDILAMSRIFLEEDTSIRVDTGKSATEALELLEKNDYDVLISDYAMPPGMNSNDLLKLLRKKNNDIPFIVFTGRGREEVAIEALNNGAAFYLQKSAHPEVQYTELRNMIHHLAAKRHAERELRLREQENRMILDNIPVIIFTLGVLENDPLITTLNPAFEKLTGYPSETAVGKPFASLLYTEDIPRIQEILGILRSGKIPEPCEVRIIASDKTSLTLEITFVPLCDQTSCHSVLGMAMNVTELRRNLQLLTIHEKELKAKNRELETFAYSVSHDLRAPLRIIEGYTTIIQEKFGDRLPEGATQPFSRIKSAVQRMDSMIGQILALSRSSRSVLQIQNLDLSTMVKEILDAHIREEPSRDVRVVVEPGIHADGDKTLIQAVLQNLLDNAWKFTGHTHPAEIRFGMNTEGETPEYYVHDNGAGFDAANAEKLWMPFSRYHLESEFPGNGIGLAMVHKIVERHQGSIRVESAPNKGATFFFTLPRYSNKPT